MSNAHVHEAFAAPGHDHRACADGLLERAEKLCASRGARLTDMRRRVLEALAADHGPAGAYEVIDRLSRAGERAPAPITIYRALDFLLEQGLVHRIESRNAFIACSHDHGEAGDAPVVFLICDGCGAVGESTTEEFARALSGLARSSGFRPRTPVIEVFGECAHCQGAARTRAGDDCEH